jgi:ubiquinone/menaquinone biosynthesis C-methylase UbiE
MTKKFEDHFSLQAADYARYRPAYPSSLFAWLSSIVERRALAWDCATGNGQAAQALSSHFERVVATDASAAQLAAAARQPRVSYVRALAEACPLRDRAVDLVTVAQALHWFDLDAFYAEARRVVVKGGVIALWSYGRTAIDREIDPIVERLYGETLGDSWPPERRHVEDGYRSLAFPFAAIETPTLEMTREWTLDELLGYIGTWSAFQRHAREHGTEALTDFASRMAAAWGPADRKRVVRWPLAIRAGRVPGD